MRHLQVSGLSTGRDEARDSLCSNRCLLLFAWSALILPTRLTRWRCVAMQSFLRAVCSGGFGGACLPKDLRVIVRYGQHLVVPPALLDATVQQNAAIRARSDRTSP